MSAASFFPILAAVVGGAGQRPSESGSLGGHEKRVRAIERAPGFKAVYLAADTITLPDDATQVAFDLQGGITSFGAPALTNVPALFETAPILTGPHAGKHALQINETGLYGAISSITVSSPDEADVYVPAPQSMAYIKEGTSSFSQSSLNFGGDFNRSRYGHQDLFEIWAVGADTLGDFESCRLGLAVSNGRGGGSGDVIVHGYLFVFEWPHDDISNDGSEDLY